MMDNLLGLATYLPHKEGDLIAYLSKGKSKLAGFFSTLPTLQLAFNREVVNIAFLV